MKKVSFFMLVLFSVSLVFTGCKKEGCTNEYATNYEEEADEDDGSCEYPEVQFNINSPVALKEYHLGAVIDISGALTCQSELTGYEVRIINISNDDEVVYTDSKSETGTELTLTGSWENNVSGHSDMKMEVTAKYNFDDMETTETVHFHCHPM